MIVRLEVASRKDPWWWVEDRMGFRITMPLALHRTTHADGGAVIWSLIVVTLCLRLGYHKKNTKITRTVKDEY
jgi:hypothetical protein